MRMPDSYDMPVFLELFLRPSEKDVFSKWKEVVKDRSVVNNMWDPVFSWLAGFVPENVAPNTLTLVGSFMVLQAWYLCEIYSEKQPFVVSCVSVVAIVLFWILGGIDGKHARKIMNDTSLGELFKYVSDLVSTVFLIIVLYQLLVVDGALDAQWYCVQTWQLVLFTKHFSAFVREAGLRYLIIGPGELISLGGGLLLIKAVLGIDILGLWYRMTWGAWSPHIVSMFDLDATGYLATMGPARGAYVSMWLFAFFRIALSRKAAEKHSWTQKTLLLIMVLRAISGFLRIDVMFTQTTSRDVIFDGLFMGMVTADLVVAKMAGREVHVWVVLFATMVVMPHLQLLILCFVVFYYTAVFADLMNHMNMPLLQVCRNVYCDGIYDLCHTGHKNLFRRALSMGNRLFVGVVGDEDANSYKRPPIMSASEREAEVASCKCVTKVIKNAPCFGLTEEYIKKHRIHVVAFGQEYEERFPNPDDDPYYKVPRKLGIAKPLPRTDGLSTSELIKRIQDRDPDNKKTPGA